MFCLSLYLSLPFLFSLIIIFQKSGNLKLLKLLRSVQACNGIALLFTIFHLSFPLSDFFFFSFPVYLLSYLFSLPVVKFYLSSIHIYACYVYFSTFSLYCLLFPFRFPFSSYFLLTSLFLVCTTLFSFYLYLVLMILFHSVFTTNFWNLFNYVLVLSIPTHISSVILHSCVKM